LHVTPEIVYGTPELLYATPPLSISCPPLRIVFLQGDTEALSNITHPLRILQGDEERVLRVRITSPVRIPSPSSGVKDMQQAAFFSRQEV
jgi:hypothetical protein